MTLTLLLLYIVACGFYVWVKSEISYLGINRHARDAYLDKVHQANWHGMPGDWLEIMRAYELFRRARK